MLNRLCFPVAVTALVSLLVFQGSAVADAPVSLSLPTLPGSPSVTVTNDGGGAGAEVGAGDTAVGVGAGTSGVGVTTHARGTSQPKSSPDLGEPVSAPVIAPRRPAGDGRLAQPGSGGAGGTVFGPGSGGKAAGTAAARSGKPGRAVRNGPKTSPVQAITPGWFGRWFIRKYIAPSSKGTRAQAPKKIQPAKNVEFSVVDAFLRSNNVVRELIARASEYDVNRIRFKNPFIPLLRFTVGTGLEIISKHQNRHLLQAERVRQSSAFPG